jgi:hypothetical protein
LSNSNEISVRQSLVAAILLILAGSFFGLINLSLDRLVALVQAAPGLSTAQASSQCGPLPPPTGNIINVNPAQAGQLSSIVANAATGDTIMLGDGLASHNLRQRDGGIATLAGNLANAPMSLFVNGSGGDLHLVNSASAAVDQGGPIAAGMSNDDIDGALRDAAPDLGADEYPANLPYAVYLPIVLKN